MKSDKHKFSEFYLAMIVTNQKWINNFNARATLGIKTHVGRMETRHFLFI